MSEIFTGCTIAFAGIYHSLTKVKSEIVDNGGNVSSLCSTVTHLVTTDFQLGTTTVEKAQQYNAFILSEAWLNDSLQQGSRLPESRYFLGDKQPNDAIAKEKQSAAAQASESLRSSFSSSFSTFSQESPLRLQPSLLESNLPQSYATPYAIPYKSEPEPTQEPEPYFSSFSSYDTQQAPESMKSNAPKTISSSTEQTNALPQWVPFKTTKKVKTRTVNVNHKQPVAFSDSFEIIGETTLQLSNLGNNNNKYYALELHEDKNASHSLPYRVFCHYGRTCDLSKNPKAGQRCFRYLSSLQDAKICFQNLYDEKTKKGYKPLKLLSSNIGSEKAQQIRLLALGSAPSQVQSSGSSISVPQENSLLEPELQRLVRLMYEEASNAITASVNAKITAHGIETALGVLTLSQVQSGEQILLRIKSELEGKKKRSSLESLSNEFFSLIPHKIGRSANERSQAIIDSLGKLEQKLELLQLMKDMLSLISAGGVGNVVDMQYKALKTNLIPLARNSSTWKEVSDFVLGTQTTSTNETEIENIFAIRRISGEEKLYSVIGNVQLQFHGSRACNFVGLLSRGILLPKVVVSRGGGRTDAGLLGNGIYFSDSFTTAAQYAHPSSIGSRFVLANRVALGRCKDFLETQIGMSEPPFGYHSVHGVSQSTNSSSAFKDNEYVVFETRQQVQEYLIEFRSVQSSDRVIPISFTPDPLPSSFFANSDRSSSNPTSYRTSSSYSTSQTSYSTPSPFASSFTPQEIPEQSQTISQTSSQRTTHNKTSTTTPSSDNREMQIEEEKLRKLFISDPNNFKLQNPFVNLINVMGNSSQFNYQNLTNEEREWPSLLTKFVSQHTSGTPAICSSDKFNENWSALTENQFEGMNWNNLFVAGGSVLSCLSPDFSTSVEPDNPFNTSDIDIFVFGLSSFEANEKLRHIHDIVKRNTNGSATMIRSQHAITILGEFPYRHVQIILRIYKSPAEILMGFDIDCCCVGYNGKQIFALPRARRAITKKFNLVDLSRRSLTYETRLHKYSSRGFQVKIPDLDLQKVDTTHLYQRHVSEVTGVAKLLIFHNIQVTGTSAVRPKSVQSGVTIGGTTSPVTADSDYSDVHIPWGPNWFVAQILNSISNQNKKTAFATPADGKEASHTFVSDLHGVLQGRRAGNCLCSLCKGGNPPRGLDESSSPLKWLTENPGRQILTGSFHPVHDNEWFTDAYQSWPDIPGTIFRPVSIGSKKSQNTKKSQTAVQATSKFAGKKPRKALPAKKSQQFGAAAPPGTQFGATAASSASGFTIGGAPNFSAFGQPAPSQQFGGFSAAPPSQQFGATAASSASGFTIGGAPNFSAFGQPAPSQQFGGFSAAPPSQQFGAASSAGLVFGKTENLGEILRPAPSAVSLSNFGETIQPQSDISKLLLLVTHLCRDGLLSTEEKSTIKNLVIRRNATVISALEVFEIERDFHELADSFRRICRYSNE